MTRESGQLTAERAVALFTSDLSAHRGHTQAEVVAAIRHAIRAHSGIHGCAGEMAAAYGEHLETAALRMRWARAVIEGNYSAANRGIAQSWWIAETAHAFKATSGNSSVARHSR